MFDALLRRDSFCHRLLLSFSLVIIVRSAHSHILLPYLRRTREVLS